jgi:sec-independent protein translocase protein TatC
MSDLPQDNAPEESFFSHLVELRDRIIKASIAILVVFISMVYWAPDIFHALADPMLKALPAGAHMIVTDVTGSFFVPIKVTFMAAFVVALPVVIYQIWAFIAPGLYNHEKKQV